MGNRSGRPVGGQSISPRIRGAFSTALDSLARKKRPLDKLIEKALEEDLKGTLSALAKYMPQELDVKINDAVTEMTDAELYSIAAGSSNRITEKAKSKKESTGVH